jgi:anti-sigma regulatory factor (Ser/Thr protein kinase)
MQPKKKRLIEKLRPHHFDLKHVLLLFIVLVAAQVLISFVQKISLRDFLVETQEWYQRDSAERFANLAATSMELLLETTSPAQRRNLEERRKIVQAFDIIFSQQLLLQHVVETCVLVSNGDKIFAVDNGEVLYEYFFDNQTALPPSDMPHDEAMRMYQQFRGQLASSEQIHSVLEGKQTFHVFVPFVPKGEYAGAVYIKNAPDFGFVTKEILASYNQSSLVVMGMILFGFIGMFFISSSTVQERDEAQHQLFKEREDQLKERIHYQKEAQFAKRIYHTHHKAEKVMGFIKEDLRALTAANLDEIKHRVTKYANFMSRVIYDMKSYDPPIQVIRNPIFQTDLNEVIRFIIDHICLRTAKLSGKYKFLLDLDERLPVVHINEFVVWEILEPLLQNSMDHGGEKEVIVTVRTQYDRERRQSQVLIADNGKGILPELLQPNEKGIKRLFLENISTKGNGHSSGYGCYLAYEISKQRCGWELDVENLPEHGCQFKLVIPDHDYP